MTREIRFRMDRIGGDRPRLRAACVSRIPGLRIQSVIGLGQWPNQFATVGTSDFTEATCLSI